jgi:hypothetical protein
VYVYTPPVDQRVDFLVTGNGFDAALFVSSSDSVVACNDDGWGRDPRLDRVPLRGGVRYFIVVDGPDAACGAFDLIVQETPPLCPLPCSGLLEGEIVCHSTYVDTYDCGCNQFPPAFRDLACADGGLTVCGSFGTYAYGSEEWRDTDWYRLEITQPGVVTCRATGQAEIQLALMRARDGCDDRPLVCESTFAPACMPAVCEAALDPGTYYVFVAPRHFVGVECGAAYRLQIDGALCPPIAVQSTSWSRVRALYR